MIQVYYGNGKGKTTAALGAVLRAGGAGLRPVVVQFLKGRQSGERQWLADLSVPVYHTESVKFYREMSPAEQEVCRRENWACFEQAAAAVDSGSCDLLVLDEVLDVVSLSILPLSALTDLLDRAGCEVLLTGHSLPEEIRQRADYITEMAMERHPYQKGVTARQGIEF